MQIHFPFVILQGIQCGHFTNINDVVHVLIWLLKFCVKFLTFDTSLHNQITPQKTNLVYITKKLHFSIDKMLKIKGDCLFLPYD